jgi:hypothetical protein
MVGLARQFLTRAPFIASTDVVWAGLASTSETRPLQSLAVKWVPRLSPSSLGLLRRATSLAVKSSPAVP